MKPKLCLNFLRNKLAKEYGFLLDFIVKFWSTALEFFTTKFVFFSPEIISGKIANNLFCLSATPTTDCNDGLSVFMDICTQIFIYFKRYDGGDQVGSSIKSFWNFYATRGDNNFKIQK